MAAGDSPTFEGVFYSRLDKKGWLHQPSFVRRRHRYRGHRESLKINQEIDSLYADMSYLDMELTEAENNLDTYVSNILNGVTHTGITYTDEDATPVDFEVTILSIDTLAANMAALEQRIERLENG